MIRSPIELPADAADHAVARLAALATLAWMAESLVPTTVPGLKPGIANVVVLYARFSHGLNDAVWVAFLRVLAGGILLGTFLSPGFALGLAGTTASCAALAAASALPARWFGPVGHSVLAALAHVAGQLTFASWWLIPPSGVLWIAPPLAAGAVVFGVVNGVVVARMLRADPPPPVPAS